MKDRTTEHRDFSLGFAVRKKSPFIFVGFLAAAMLFLCIAASGDVISGKQSAPTSKIYHNINLIR